MDKTTISKISIVMTAYNGSKYILKQLESIRTQSRPADEVIICDDRSIDDTFQLVQDYILEHGLEASWKVYENEANLGWRRNFYEATKKATGDIIFFSDHDDIWENDKLEKMAYIMERTGAGCVFGDAVEIDAEDNLILSRTGKKEFGGKCPRKKFTTSFNSLKTLGCRMCISRDVADIYIKLDCADMGHDSQCGILALLFSKYYCLDQPVIKYRVHQGNNSGISSDGVEGFSSLEFRIYDTRESIKMLKAILASKELVDRLSKGRVQIVEKTLELQEKRLCYLAGENGLDESDCASAVSDTVKYKVSPVSWFSLWKYAKYYSGIGMLVGDLAYKYGLNHALGKALRRFKRLING